MRYTCSAAVAGLLVLAACSGNDVKTSLGLDRGAPDEFRVVSRPPLSVPPEFDLRPPESAAAAALINQDKASSQAESLLSDDASAKPSVKGVAVGKAPSVPAATSTSKPGTSAESAFLQNIGASQADPKVRQEIAEEQVVLQAPEEDSTSWWNFWSSANKPKADPLVNAGKESDRIKTDADSGQPVTTGDTPTIKDRDTGLLGKILGY